MNDRYSNLPFAIVVIALLGAGAYMAYLIFQVQSAQAFVPGVTISATPVETGDQVKSTIVADSLAPSPDPTSTPTFTPPPTAAPATPAPTFVPYTPTAAPAPRFVVWSAEAENVYLRELPNGRVLADVANASLADDTGARLNEAGLTWARVCVRTPMAYSAVTACGWMAADFLFPWEPGEYAVVRADLGANLRTSPNGSIATWLPDGTPLRLSGRYDGDWREVYLLNGVYGWVHTSLLQPAPSLSSTSPTSTPAPAAPAPMPARRGVMQSILPVHLYTETVSHTLYLPFVSREPARVDVTDDILAHSLIGVCRAVDESDSFSWNAVYTCNSDGRIVGLPSSGWVSLSRTYEPGMQGYPWGQAVRWYIEYPLPQRVSPDQVLGLQICLSTQYWRPDEVFVQQGTWERGAVQNIALDPNPDKMPFVDEFMADIWQAHGETQTVIPPLPSYNIYHPCTDTFFPVTPDEDGVLRLVLRTADDAQPPDHGTYGFGSFTFDDGVYFPSSIYLVYQP